MKSKISETVDPIQSHTLRNGLSVLLKPVRYSPIVSVWCWYRTGSSDERPGITGIAHWLEHMNFKGTARFTREQMKNLIEKHGGYWNGYTWIDQTSYFETLPREHIDLALELEAERMNRSLIDPVEFEQERTVILSELRGGENSPESLLDREVTAAVFQAHSYRWPTVGWEPDVERITHAEIVDFYRTHYIPRNATLVVVGDFSPTAVLKKVRRLFGGFPDRPVPETFKTPERTMNGERRVNLEGGSKTSYLHVAYPAPSVRDGDIHTLALLDSVLGGAKGINLWSYDSESRKSSPLYEGMVNGGYTSGMRSFFIPTRDPFLYYLSATICEGVSVEKAEKKLYSILERAASEKPTRRDLQKAKNQLRATVVFQSDSVTELAHQIGYFHTIDHYTFFETFLSKVEAITGEDVRDLASRLFQSRNRTVGVYRPSGRRGRNR